MKRLFTYILALSLLPQITSTAAVVGKTEGTFAVSPAGAATYTIPLTILKGMSDFKPELSLFYDSKAGNGTMGLGWSIKGMHTISMVPKCYFYDGTDQGTAYALDGMRLLETNGANGQLYYRTEHDQGDSIIITAAQNGTPTTFKIKAADGSIYKYGSSTGRYINGDNSKWALDYAQDALGNYISYTYDQNGGLYPTSITYGRNIHGTAGVDCTILFTYDSSTPKRLTKIECKYNNSIYRSYTFNYTESPSRLTSVTEGGRASTTFAPTVFEWNQNRISSITDGLGARESFTYGEAEWTPVVVSRTESIPTESKTTNYSYATGYYNAYDEIIGFALIQEESSTGIVTERHFTDNANFIALLPDKVIQKNTSGDVIQIDYNTLSIEPAGGHAYRTKEIDRSLEKPLDGLNEELSYYYDKAKLIYIWSRDELCESYKNIITWDSPIDTIRIKGLPNKVEVTRVGTGYGVNGYTFETTIYERDPRTGLVLKETKKRGTCEEDQLPVSIDGYSYNAYGQVTQHYTVAYNSTDTLVTTYQYNAKGLLSKEYNPLGQYKTYSYNAYTGALTSVVEFDGSTTSYTYDAMLRETKYDAASKVVTTARSTASYGGSVYAIAVSETDKAPITTYYDAWGRKVAESIRCVVSGAANKIIYTDYKYNSIGKIGFVSFPHKSNETGNLGTTYTYDDPAQRLTRTEDTNGKINTWEYEVSYGWLKITSCIDGVTSVKIFLAPKSLFRVTNEDSTGWTDITEYYYNSDGNYETIDIGYGGAYGDGYSTYYEYDVLGRVIRTTDMNGTIKEYTYDVNGYPKKVSIGDSYVETNYDKFGRLLSKTWYQPEDEDEEYLYTANYTYNTDVKKRHLVAQEQGDNYTYTYTYDSKGRLTGKIRSVLSGSLQQYANIGIQYYNNNNRQVSKKTCTFGFNSNKTYEEDFIYQDNCLIQDSLDHVLVWRPVFVDNRGYVRAEAGGGPFLSTTYTYDDYGHILSIDNIYTRERSYAYDLQTGNMIEGDSISLTYDNMNRLTGWGDHEYSYDDKGNIEHQPLVGTFHYNDFKTSFLVDGDLSSSNEKGLEIIYNKALGIPLSIKNENYLADFEYDGEGKCIYMGVSKIEGRRKKPCFKRYYLDDDIEVNVDSNGGKKGYFYAGNDAQTAPAVLVVQPGSAVAWKILRDNTGNAIDYFRGHSCYEFTYNPWGVRTALDDPTNFYKPGESLGDCPFYRTYRGYEDLWMFGLLFDKTRLYDPYQGRYLSPDPTLGIIGRSYDFNPYVFSKNNPFKKF